MRFPIVVTVALLVQLEILATGSNPSPPYNILFLLPMSSRSHKNVLDPVARELARRGHQVTVMSPYKEKEIGSVNEVYLSSVDKVMREEQKTFNFFVGLPTSPTFILRLVDMQQKVINATYHEPEIAELLATPAAFRYDVMVVDGIFNEFVLPLAHHMGLPTVLISPAHKFVFHSWSMNIPSPYAYVPMGVNFIDGPMTFLERAKNAILSVLIVLVRSAVLLPMSDALIKNFIPNSPPISELESNVSFFMANTHPSIQPSVPLMPSFEEVGCLNCIEAKPLPKELEDFMQSSGEDGVIYFSIGSMTRGDDMPADMRQKLVWAFSQLQQKVLWKYESDIGGLPENIKLVQWAPQQDILAHNKTRLFITHGGGLSTTEAVYHRCPILGFPLSADQLGNMGNAISQGFAEWLDWKTFTAQELLGKIQLMLKEDRYQARANHLSDLLRDRPQHPVETAAYWIEYVVRHQGAHHLKSEAENLNFFQYFLLDVIGAITAVVVTVTAAVWFVMRLLFRAIFRKQTAPKPESSATKKNKKKKQS